MIKEHPVGTEPEHKRRHWKNHIESWQRSRLSQIGYCRQNGLKLHQFTYWKKRIQHKDRDIAFFPLNFSQNLPVVVNPSNRAINYALKNWDKLIVYIDDGLLRPDNNVAGNAIRPFVVGRKNWLFAGHPNGAHAGAAFFTLIKTAKANDLEPYAYLRCLFEQLPLVKDQKEYRQLLPQYIDRDLINRTTSH